MQAPILWDEPDSTPVVRARLTKQVTADGVDMTDVPVGTEYNVFPASRRIGAWGRTDAPGITYREMVWVRRSDRPHDVGGWMPTELFDLGAFPTN